MLKLVIYIIVPNRIRILLSYGKLSALNAAEKLFLNMKLPKSLAVHNSQREFIHSTNHRYTMPLQAKRNVAKILVATDPQYVRC